MAEDQAVQVTMQTFLTLLDIIQANSMLQTSLTILGVSMAVLMTLYRRISYWITTRSFYYKRPHVARFVSRVLLPLLGSVQVTIINSQIQTGFLWGAEQAVVDDLLILLLNSFNVLAAGFAIAHLVPIVMSNLEKRHLEEADFAVWFERRGFSDDHDGLFQRLYKWIPPPNSPEDIDPELFKSMLETEEGRAYLERYNTSHGNPVGSYVKRQKHPFKEYQKSERRKYNKYYGDCISGNNQLGRKMMPDAHPIEIFPIDIWREEKRNQSYEPVIPGDRPPGYIMKQHKEAPVSIRRILPWAIFGVAALVVVALWGVDLLVLATATGGLSIGVGLALQETMQNFFAYMMIRKDKIVEEGDRVELDTGYLGDVHRITPRVAYIMDPQFESVAIVPTKQLINAQIVNYTKENRLVPAKVKVGVSYLNSPRQVVSILRKVGLRAMKEVTDDRGRHLVRQSRCPYLDEGRTSCGCDIDLYVNVRQPRVRFEDFGESSQDFTLWVYVRNYRAQHKVKTNIRVMIYEEFQKYDIRIPWPIRTIYQSDEKKEKHEIDQQDTSRRKVIDEYGPGSVMPDDHDVPKKDYPA